MIAKADLIVQLLKLVDEVWQSGQVDAHRRGAPKVYSEQSMFKVNLVNVLKHLWSHRSVWRVLTTYPALQQACGLKRVPDRRTLDRRLAKLAPLLEEQIEGLGLSLVLEEITDGQSAAGDGSVLEACGQSWDRTDQKANYLPPKSHGVDTQAAWLKSGYHGWTYGYKMHVVSSIAPTTVRAVLAARVTSNDSENYVMRELLTRLPASLESVWLDKSYDDKHLIQVGAQRNLAVLAPLRQAIGKTTSLERRQRYAYLHTPQGRARYQRRAASIEPFFGTLKDLFPLQHLPVRGLARVANLVLGTLYTWNLLILYNFISLRPLGAFKSILEVL